MSVGRPRLPMAAVVRPALTICTSRRFQSTEASDNAPLKSSRLHATPGNATQALETSEESERKFYNLRTKTERLRFEYLHRSMDRAGACFAGLRQSPDGYF